MVILGILSLMFVCAGLYALSILFKKGREMSFEHRFMIAATPLLVCLMFSLLVSTLALSALKLKLVLSWSATPSPTKPDSLLELSGLTGAVNPHIP